MKYGARSHEGATLTLAVPTALPKHMRGPIVELRALHTKPDQRGNGYAAFLMLQTTIEADMAGYFLFLAVEPEGVDRQRLISLYGRNGFIPIQAEPLLMIRPPIGVRMAA